MKNTDLFALKTYNKFNYNPKYLSNISDETKYILINKINYILSNYKNNNFIGYPGLSYIINNCINPSPYNNINYIYTIYKITNLYSTDYNMNIYLFGDYHTKNYKCNNNVDIESVSSFILNQIKTSNDFVDLFIELPLIDKNTDRELIKYNTYISDLNINLYNCLYWDKYNCIYPHLRAHNIDVRSSEYIHEYFKLFNLAYTLHISFKTLYKNIDNTLDEKIIKELKFNFRKYRNYYHSINKKNVFDNKESIINYFNDVYNYTKIEKQLNNINDENLRFKIKNYFNNILTNYNFSNILSDNIDNFIDSFKQIINKDDLIKLYLYQFNNIMSTYITCSSYFMDFYTIARLFRTYKYLPNKYSGRATSIIIYTGNYHIEIYKKFLLSIFFNIKISLMNENIKDYECLNIENIKQPIFRYKNKQSFEL
jgi:hypothetical protein